MSDSGLIGTVSHRAVVDCYLKYTERGFGPLHHLSVDGFVHALAAIGMEIVTDKDRIKHQSNGARHSTDRGARRMPVGRRKARREKMLARTGRKKKVHQPLKVFNGMLQHIHTVGV